MKTIRITIILLLTAVLSVFSTGVLAYISMATPIGPWIAPMLVLIASVLFKTVFSFVSMPGEAIALTTAGASIGGILATAFGFSFPTFYFLDQDLFNSWLADPWYFFIALGLLAIAAGYLGFMIANTLERRFIIKEQMPFPIGQLVYKMIAAQSQTKKAVELAVGFFASLIFCGLQGGIKGFKGVMRSYISLTKGVKTRFVEIPQISINLAFLPMLLAIGFITGHVIAIPLIAGALSKTLIMEPINAIFFPDISKFDFMLAFASGLVFIGAVMSFLQAPKLISNAIKGVNLSNINHENNGYWHEVKQAITIPGIIALFIILIIFFAFFNFGILQSLYLVIFTYVCTYQVTLIAGKIGLAQLGRFATFVMVPAIFLFGANPVHVTFIATFVEICAGVATDVLFGRKMAYLAEIEHKKIKWIQLFGLVISTLTVGVVFWLLIKQFGLGSEELFAQRAQARALLINIRSFNFYVILIGSVFGYLLKLLKLSPMLVLSGLIMPLNFSLALIAGGLLSFGVRNRQEWEPFWSGVFAGNSIWMLLKTVF